MGSSLGIKEKTFSRYKLFQKMLSFLDKYFATTPSHYQNNISSPDSRIASHFPFLFPIGNTSPLSRDHLRTRIPALEKTFISKFDSDAAKAFNYLEIPCTTSYSDSQIESQLALPLPFLLGMPASNFALDSKSFQIT